MRPLNACRESGLHGSACADIPAGSLSLIIILLLCTFFALPAFLFAQALTGKVNNGTTGTPAAGDSVVLITLGQGMEEVAHTRSDASGHFSFRVPDTGPHLIRAVHQGVAYHRPVPPGSNSVAMTVFDVSRKVKGIAVTADVMRLQAQGGELQGTRLFAVNNASNPPRTQMHGSAFEFFLPDGAVIDQGIATTAGGQPVNSSPVPEREKNRYRFVFPLRPGETELQVVFHMAYRGELSIDPKALYATENFVAMVPKTMLFTAAPGIAFQAMEDPRQPDALVRVMSNTRAGQPLSFTISGTGTLTDPGDDSLGAPHPVREETVAPPARDSGSAGRSEFNRGRVSIRLKETSGMFLAVSSWYCWPEEASIWCGAHAEGVSSTLTALTGKACVAHLQPSNLPAPPVFSSTGSRMSCFSSK